MLFNLPLANIAILLCLFFFALFLTLFLQFLKLVLDIPRGAPTAVVNDVIEMLLLVSGKTINDLST